MVARSPDRSSKDLTKVNMLDSRSQNAVQLYKLVVLRYSRDSARLVSDLRDEGHDETRAECTVEVVRERDTLKS